MKHRETQRDQLFVTKMTKLFDSENLHFFFLVIVSPPELAVSL